ncbi:hypothetical protein [Ferruginibacter sp. HRS2-29]|uniref:hypothetical protein n=1 Tax=Ferruginibacter sp. HRS2-29 TaxID=2487334 RepID=UPI0020CD6281|nr:hypothetical protein [Ferruginibacter sp. HRS2-29]MCP9752927.1 hypothetical protein [Ferruginibacter sp. HRS2-29]
MKKRKWLLLVLLALAIWGYIGLFYKTYSREMVPKNADAILMLDVKRITNTLIWNTITTPGQWKIGRIFSKRKKEVRLKDMIDIPDYVMAFHVKGQPVGAWFLTLDIGDEEDFQNGLQQYHFVKSGHNEYVNAGFRVLKNGGRILLGRSSEKYRAGFNEVAHELFVQKEYVADQMIRKAIRAKSHLALQVNPGTIMESDGLLTANFDKEKISVEGKFTPRAEYVPEEMKFSYRKYSFCNIGFVQPPHAAYSLLSDSTKQKIKRAVNIDIDSVFLPGKNSYYFDFNGIVTRSDTAITYEMDEDFNRVEKKVLNKVTEPSYSLMISGDSVKNIYRYFKRNDLVEKTDKGELFRPMPLVASYVQLPNDTQINISSFNYSPSADIQEISCLFFQRVRLEITDEFWKLMPEGFRGLMGNVSLIMLQANKKGKEVIVSGTIQKKKNDLPVIKL